MNQSAPAPYRERLLPTFWSWLGIIGFALFTYIALVVADTTVAAICAPLVLAAGVIAAWVTAPVIKVENGTLTAGRAHIGVHHLGQPVKLDREAITRALGPGFDPRTFACLRVGTGNALLLEVTDPRDPTPAWIVSTRRPDQLAHAITVARSAG